MLRFVTPGLDAMRVAARSPFADSIAQISGTCDHPGDLLRGLDFGHPKRQRMAGDSGEIGQRVGGSGCVDAHDRGTLGSRFGDQATRAILEFGRHGVLEVENHRVGTRVEHLGHQPLVVPWSE
jgi:hypothetical protein